MSQVALVSRIHGSDLLQQGVSEGGRSGSAQGPGIEMPSFRGLRCRRGMARPTTDAVSQLDATIFYEPFFVQPAGPDGYARR